MSNSPGISDNRGIRLRAPAGAVGACSLGGDATSRASGRWRQRESRRSSSEPVFRDRTLYNPQMQGIPWTTIALGSLLLIPVCSKGGQQVEAPQAEQSKAPAKTEQHERGAR